MEEKLKRIYEECIKELGTIGITFDAKIEITLSKRNNKRYGCCKPQLPDERYKEMIQKGFRRYILYHWYRNYIIEISKWVMELDESIIKNTIIHELIHCLPYCNNHGKEFKHYAQLISEKLGYGITRAGNKREDYEKSNKNYEETQVFHYKIQCEKCEQVFFRKRLARNFVKKYRCRKCMGKFKVTPI